MKHVTPPTRVPARPTRPTEIIPNPTPAYGIRRSSRGTGLSEDLTAGDVDIHLDPVPIPFNLLLSHHHFASRGIGENEEQIEETSLWWYHPIFEAGAKANIRRTLSALLPSDLSQDPSPVDIMGDWRAEVRPRRPGVQIWEQLGDGFGPGSLDRLVRLSLSWFSLET